MYALEIDLEKERTILRTSWESNGKLSNEFYVLKAGRST